MKKLSLIVGLVGIILSSCARNPYDRSMASSNMQYRGQYLGNRDKDLPHDMEHKTTHPYVGEVTDGKGIKRKIQNKKA